MIGHLPLKINRTYKNILKLKPVHVADISLLVHAI